jgi:hypothetical protein
MTNGLADRVRLGTLRFVIMTAMLLPFSERSASAVGQAALLRRHPPEAALTAEALAERASP